MLIKIPETSLVLLIGTSGSGKSTFASKHFRDSEIISSDYCRGLVSDDEGNQSVSKDAFDLLEYIVRKRLKNKRLTVIDATNVQADYRKGFIALAKEYHFFLAAIIFNIEPQICIGRNKQRSDRDFGEHVIRSQYLQLKKTIHRIKHEGFKFIYRLDHPEIIEEAILQREKPWNDRLDNHGPFDIIGDVHGCFDELMLLVEKLGYTVQTYLDGNEKHYQISHSHHRQLIFLGDIVDRGPKIPEVIQFVKDLVAKKQALCVPGNHDLKLQKYLSGRKVTVNHGLEESIRQLEAYSEGYKKEIADFFYNLISHYVLDDGKLVVAHAGMKEEYQGRGSSIVRSFALYGETTGETDEFGLPIRYPWASDYRGRAMVVYGHTPVPESEWLNNTINIDNGCVFGGKLTALRYPEKEIVSVDANKTYCEPVKPLSTQNKPLSQQQDSDDLLYYDDVSGKKHILTSFHFNVNVHPGQASAALEIMSRYTVNPKWLIYLPPTMSPCRSSDLHNYLEYPTEVFTYFKNQKVHQVICEEKHMGSRAVIVVCKDKDTALRRFGIVNEEIGVIYTRTGRSFFKDKKFEQQLLDLLVESIGKADVWEYLKTDWLCLDAEIMPWSVKAHDLIKFQYAGIASSGIAAATHLTALLESATNNGVDLTKHLSKARSVLADIQNFAEVYQRYCWQIKSINDIRIAVFHVLASEGKVHHDQDHLWHTAIAHRIAHDHQKMIIKTAHKLVTLPDKAGEDEATQWWLELTQNGGEGIVVKPLNFIVKNSKGYIQPTIKCRGREYLRIIYGSDYTRPENLERLKKRNLGTKRSLAIKEFLLGLEALQRFVNKEALRHVHECVFGVLAMESDAVDPRL